MQIPHGLRYLRSPVSVMYCNYRTACKPFIGCPCYLQGMSSQYPQVPERPDQVDPARLYSCDELAHAVGYEVSSTTIWRRVRDGVLPSVPQVKEVILIRGADFLAWWQNPRPRRRLRSSRKSKS